MLGGFSHVLTSGKPKLKGETLPILAARPAQHGCAFLAYENIGFSIIKIVVVTF
jgi:hypothetical protein